MKNVRHCAAIRNNATIALISCCLSPPHGLDEFSFLVATCRPDAATDFLGYIGQSPNMASCSNVDWCCFHFLLLMLCQTTIGPATATQHSVPSLIFTNIRQSPNTWWRCHQCAVCHHLQVDCCFSPSRCPQRLPNAST